MKKSSQMPGLHMYFIVAGRLRDTVLKALGA